MADRVCQYYDCNTLDYDRAISLQNRLAFLRSRQQIPDTILLLEHPPTYTLGRKSKEEHFFVPQNWIRQKHVAVRQVDRGGEITFHGPGQLVGYPVIQLDRSRRDVVGYVRKLETMLQQVLADFNLKRNIPGHSTKHRIGVWVNDAKIAAIGIRVDIHMVTTHGFALNVSPDLSYFDKIVPCGIGDKSVCSMTGLLGASVDMQQVKERILLNFAEVFGYERISVGHQLSQAIVA